MIEVNRAASLALAVVNDSVLTYADDKTGHILSRLYLQSELPGVVEEPNFFFDLTEPRSGRALRLATPLRQCALCRQRGK